MASAREQVDRVTGPLVSLRLSARRRIELVPSSDGTCKMPQTFYIGLDFGTHEELLADDGLVHIPIGCFLLRSGGTTVLIDAGLGDVEVGWGRGGELPGGAAPTGASAEDIDVVVCSHLHIDHIGWLVVDDVPYFPNAVVRYGAADWQRFVAGADADDRGRQIMEVLAAAGRLEPLDGDMLRIAPGLTAPAIRRGTRSATTGLSSRRARIVPCSSGMPWNALCSWRNRTSIPCRTWTPLWRPGRAKPCGASSKARTSQSQAAHFPGLQFGRVLAGTGQAPVLTAELTRCRASPAELFAGPDTRVPAGRREPTTVTG